MKLLRVGGLDVLASRQMQYLALTFRVRHDGEPRGLAAKPALVPVSCVYAQRGSGLRRLPIIALTASALKEDIDRSLGAGCDVHLPKPISKVTLLEMIVRQTEDRTTV